MPMARGTKIVTVLLQDSKNIHQILMPYKTQTHINFTIKHNVMMTTSTSKACNHQLTNNMIKAAAT